MAFVVLVGGGVLLRQRSKKQRGVRMPLLLSVVVGVADDDFRRGALGGVASTWCGRSFVRNDTRRTDDSEEDRVDRRTVRACVPISRESRKERPLLSR